jgi:hypothetical protein
MGGMISLIIDAILLPFFHLVPWSDHRNPSHRPLTFGYQMKYPAKKVAQKAISSVCIKYGQPQELDEKGESTGSRSLIPWVLAWEVWACRGHTTQ